MYILWIVALAAAFFLGRRTSHNLYYVKSAMDLAFRKASVVEGHSYDPRRPRGSASSDRDNPQVEIIHLGKYKSLTKQQRRWLKRRQAVEQTIGYLKSDHWMDRYWLQGKLGDPLHALLCATD